VSGEGLEQGNVGGDAQGHDGYPVDHDGSWRSCQKLSTNGKYIDSEGKNIEIVLW
jgi:hypothetical protein